MIEGYISRMVVTIGPDWENPRGGIAQVLKTYSTIYNPFSVIITSKSGNLLCNLYQFFKAINELLFRYNKREIKIVHIHTASYRSFWRKAVFVYLSKLINKKVVLHIHGAEFKKFAAIHYKLIRKVLLKCDKIVVLSKSWKEWFETEFDINDVIIINNIIETPKTSIESKCVNEKLIVLFLGEIGKRKGIYDLLEALTKYKELYGNNIQLIIGGNGEVEKVKSYILEKHLKDIVEYKGWVSGNDKVHLLNSADIFVLPSYNEGLPISILEAMGYGIPVITTPVGGIPEVIIDGENGLLVSPGDVDGLFNAILELAKDTSLRKKMSESSRRGILLHLPNSVSDTLGKLYKQLLKD